MEPDPAERLILKLRAFVNEDLEDQERALFAALIAPGVARAYDDDEITGFAMTDWSSDRLPAALAEAIRRSGIRVVGLEVDSS